MKLSNIYGSRRQSQKKKKKKKVNLTLPINKIEITDSSSLATRQYSIEPRTRKYVKGCRFLSFARIFY